MSKKQEAKKQANVVTDLSYRSAILRIIKLTKREAVQAAIDRWTWASVCHDPKEYLDLNSCPLCNQVKQCKECVLFETEICHGLYWDAIHELDLKNLPEFRKFALQIIEKLEIRKREIEI